MKQLKATLLMLSAMGLAACQPAQESTSDTTEAASQAAASTDNTAAPQASGDTATASSELEKQSYALGVSIGSIITQASEKYQTADITLDQAQIIAGIQEQLAGTATLTPQQTNALMQSLEMTATQNLEAKHAKLAEENVAKGQAYLAENAARPEVTVTDSGLQYEVLVEGDGVSPTPADTVTVHYRGTLIDGTEFDSSFSRNEPTSFRVNRVIAGWTEGLQLMKQGAKYRFVIPAELAYGERAVGEDISPNSTLIFEVELLDVKKPDAEPSQG